MHNRYAQKAERIKRKLQNGKWLWTWLGIKDENGNIMGDCSICKKSGVVAKTCSNCGSEMEFEQDGENEEGA